MTRSDPWQTAEIPGPRRAVLLGKPEAVASIVKKMSRPLLVAGHLAGKVPQGDEKLADWLIALCRASGIPLAATAHAGASFLSRGFSPVANLPAVEIARRLGDPEWKGFDGEGRYDLAFFSGIPYQMEWTILSGLKHFATSVRTFSLDNKYQPQADWSLPNMSDKEWRDFFRELVIQAGR